GTDPPMPSWRIQWQVRCPTGRARSVRSRAPDRLRRRDVPHLLRLHTVGKQLRREALALRDALDLERDRLDGLLESRHAVVVHHDVARGARLAERRPRSFDEEADDDDQRPEEADCDDDLAWIAHGPVGLEEVGSAEARTLRYSRASVSAIVTTRRYRVG